MVADAANDTTAIAIAKTDYRDALNAGDIEGLLAVFAPSFTDFSDGFPSFYGAEARDALRLRMEAVFRDYKVKCAPIIVKIVVQGDIAYDYGWHKTWLEPKAGGPVIYRKERYFETWKRQEDGSWKLNLIITNQELLPAMLPAIS